MADAILQVLPLVAMAINLGLAKLDWKPFSTKLSHIDKLTTAIDTADLTRKLLTCVYQATDNSSETTRRAAHQLSIALHATFEWNINSLVEDYRTCVEQVVSVLLLGR